MNAKRIQIDPIPSPPPAPDRNTVTANQKLTCACEWNVCAAALAANADELEIFRAAAACAGEYYRRLTREYSSGGDGELDARVDAALDRLEVVCLEWRRVHGEIL